MARSVKLYATPGGGKVARPEETIALRQLFEPWTIDDLVALQREITASYRQRGHPPTACFISPHDFTSLGNQMTGLQRWHGGVLPEGHFHMLEVLGTKYLETPGWPVSTLGYVVNL